MIQNYNEILSVLDGLFSSTAIHDVETLVSTLNKTKMKRKEQISRISSQIRQLNIFIEKYKYQIRKSAKIEDKKAKGLELNRLLKERQTLIKDYNLQRQVSAFQQLNDEAKIFACCHNLFCKYLNKNSLRAYGLLGADNSVNIVDFQNSRLFQEFSHIRDYVSSYIDNYPERVKGGKYFTGIHKNISSLADLRTEIDAYFEKLNSASEKELNNIKKSHDGFEVFTTYPNERLQAVKLLTKRALNYEGSAMHHCVGGYADKVQKGQTEIYSLRDLGEENQELLPHATIEFKNGKISQIKGPADGAVSYQYVGTTRNFLMQLTHTDNFNDIIEDKELKLAEKNNIGIHKGQDGKLYDIFHLTDVITFDKIIIDSAYLHILPLSKMKINTLELCGRVSEQDIADIFACKNIKLFLINDIAFGGEILDLSDAPIEKLDLRIKEADKLKTFICPKKIKHLALSGKMPALKEIKNSEKLETLTLNGHFNSLEALDLSEHHNLKGLDLMMSEFAALETLKLPKGLNTFMSDVSKFKVLKEIDFSQADMICFGKPLHDTSQNIETLWLFKHLRSHCLSMSLTQMPQLQKIIFPNKIQQINLAQTGLDNAKAFDFSNCKDLQCINLLFTNFPDGTAFNLAPCSQLKEIMCDYSTFSNAALPNSLTKISLHGRESMIPLPLPVPQGSAIKQISCTGFFPKLDDIPASVDNVLISNTDVELDDLQVLDLSSYDVFDMHLQHTSSFKALTEIAFSKKISCFALFASQAPNLKVLDFSHTEDNFHIGTLHFIKHDTKKWFLGDDRIFNKIQKIKLGAEIMPIIETRLTHLANLSFELHPQASQKYVDQFQRLYPHAKLIASKTSQTALKIKPAVPYLPPVQYQSHRPFGSYFVFRSSSLMKN